MSNSWFWQGRPTLVTGATGLLGSWLVRRLVDAGAHVYCLVRDWVPQSELVRSGLVHKVEVVAGDICDEGGLRSILTHYEIATVFHLAAQTIVGVANRNPVSTFEANIQGTWTVCEACRQVPAVGQIIFASSDKAYGEHDILPYDEAAPLQGSYPYDASKSCADLICQSYAHTYGLPVAVTRCGNLFGGGDLNWSRLVPGTIRSVRRGQAPVIRSDGNYVRDYLYVEDAAAAYILLAQCFAERPELRGQAFNFSNECQTTVLQLVHAILRLMESPLEPVILNQATGEIKSQYLAATKAREQLGWKPLFAQDEGLRRTIEWYTAFLQQEAS